MFNNLQKTYRVWTPGSLNSIGESQSSYEDSGIDVVVAVVYLSSTIDTTSALYRDAANVGIADEDLANIGDKLVGIDEEYRVVNKITNTRRIQLILSKNLI